MWLHTPNIQPAGSRPTKPSKSYVILSNWILNLYKSQVRSNTSVVSSFEILVVNSSLYCICIPKPCKLAKAVVGCGCGRPTPIDENLLAKPLVVDHHCNIKLFCTLICFWKNVQGFINTINSNNSTKHKYKLKDWSFIFGSKGSSL